MCTCHIGTLFVLYVVLLYARTRHPAWRDALLEVARVFPDDEALDVRTRENLQLVLESVAASLARPAGKLHANLAGVGYRQGMHELAAVVLLAMQRENRSDHDEAYLLVASVLGAAAELYQPRCARVEAIWTRQLSRLDPELARHLHSLALDPHVRPARTPVQRWASFPRRHRQS